MSELSPNDAERLADYLAGALAPVEAAAVEAWLAANPAWSTLTHELQHVAALGAADEIAQKQIDAIEATLATMRQVDASARAPRRQAPLRHTGVFPAPRYPRRIVAFASGVVAAVCAAASVMVAHHRAATPTRSQFYSTSAGQHGVVTLNNGTRIVLAPETRLDMSAVDSKSNVIVRGQALFTVAHDANTLFTVQTTRAHVRVLGTTFSVRQYANDRATRVSVVDGRVAVTDGTPFHRRVVLDASTSAVVPDDAPMIVMHANAAVSDTAWLSGVLVFNNTRVSDIIADLSRAYGVQIRLADSALARQQLSWRVSTRRNTLAEVLDDLPLLLDAHIVRSHDIITLVPGRTMSRESVPASHLLTLERHYGR